ncbi:uncharacterized protein KNAG_0D04200 [Huiozyma naganishii CBS 8797]|uniref:Secreted protein n=1 Tax=Huiozyma naganishii (strain ATCC MYA-139 / BCRC 22969 / CBS 8797 / KCTC 17520 / NBRC 10181 / NCYC 3082 / Yp74L-3) TaxID=1071383 RepID=J7S782_HUIN7|nr:hypothetical protein KNAG_0D04200 [Kazachstania naganishii CBS 8797]CCK70166.1 hypothetical protein KNAG_0D04200 [Kazachstania naganishii CBS 8797]
MSVSLLFAFVNCYGAICIVQGAVGGGTRLDNYKHLQAGSMGWYSLRCHRFRARRELCVCPLPFPQKMPQRSLAESDARPRGYIVSGERVGVGGGGVEGGECAVRAPRPFSRPRFRAAVSAGPGLDFPLRAHPRPPCSAPHGLPLSPEKWAQKAQTIPRGKL